MFFLFKQKTAYEMRISDWSSDVCSSDLGTAAGGQDERPAGEQPRDHPALALAKIALAKAREDVGDGHAGGALDLVVGVGEGQAEPLCETAADRRFARAHQYDEDARAGADRRGEVRRQSWRVSAHGARGDRSEARRGGNDGVGRGRSGG